jgi:SAM-dependent methyltransferase
MSDIRDAVLEPTPAARVWGLGGRAYDEISFGISDALGHAAQRLNPAPGEAVLDVATGTGWSARNAARMGGRVTGVDIARELLEAARALSAGVEPTIEFRYGDAQALPFDDAAFDKVISTFGVMFAPDQEAAARELGRVCKPAGRLVLATWRPGGAVAEFFGVIGKHGTAPPPDPSPLAWGDPERVEALLGGDFELVFEPGVSRAYYDDPEALWLRFMAGFGPLRQAWEALDAAGREAFRRDVDAYHARFTAPAGLEVEREYLVTVGRRH